MVSATSSRAIGNVDVKVVEEMVNMIVAQRAYEVIPGCAGCR